MKKELSGYELSRDWWNFCFENPEMISPNHSALYFFIIEHCNRLGWKEKFGLPTTMAKDAIGIKSYNTYIKTLNEIVGWGFVKVIERSKNQYSSNIIALSKNNKAHNKALDKAFIKHVTKQSESTVQSTGESISSVDKQVNQEPLQPITNNQEPSDAHELLIWPTFDDFWDLYEKKVGREKSEGLWKNVSQADREKLMQHIPKYKAAEPIKKFRKNPQTYLYNKSWNDEIISNNESGNTKNGNQFDRPTVEAGVFEHFAPKQ